VDGPSLKNDFVYFASITSCLAPFPLRVGYIPSDDVGLLLVLAVDSEQTRFSIRVTMAAIAQPNAVLFETTGIGIKSSDRPYIFYMIRPIPEFLQPSSTELADEEQYRFVAQISVQEIGGVDAPRAGTTELHFDREHSPNALSLSGCIFSDFPEFDLNSDELLYQILDSGKVPEFLELKDEWRECWISGRLHAGSGPFPVNCTVRGELFESSLNVQMRALSVTVNGSSADFTLASDPIPEGYFIASPKLLITAESAAFKGAVLVDLNFHAGPRPQYAIKPMTLEVMEQSGHRSRVIERSASNIQIVGSFSKDALPLSDEMIGVAFARDSLFSDREIGEFVDLEIFSNPINPGAFELQFTLPQLDPKFSREWAIQPFAYVSYKHLGVQYAYHEILPSLTISGAVTSTTELKRITSGGSDIDPQRLSGAHWVGRFPTSTSISDLANPFRDRMNLFLSTLSSAGARYNISATRRPAERAYLMHYAWRVAREGLDPGTVPSMAGVDIVWTHRSLAESVAAAEAMVGGYGIVYRPSFPSNHSSGYAIDVSISQLPSSLIINGTSVDISGPSDGASNTKLHSVGWRHFRVRKLVSDPPHWYNNSTDLIGA
jgi:hypothetical protein